MSRLLKLLLSVVVLVVLSLSANAVNYYVDASGGSNTNEGKLWSDAFATIQYAVNTAGANDTINVQGDFGTNVYSERVQISTGKYGLSLIGVNYPILDGTSATSNISVGFWVRVDQITIDGFIIRDYKASTDPDNFMSTNQGGAGIYTDAGTARHVFINNEIYDCNWGIYLNEAFDCTVQGNDIGSSGSIDFLNTSGGVGIMIWSDDITLERNIIGGVDAGEGNIIANCDVDGIRIGIASGSTIRADQTQIKGNSIENCGGGTGWGYGIKIMNVDKTVEITDNTIVECEHALYIEGPCLDLFFGDNSIEDCGTNDEIIVQAFNNGGPFSYGGDYLFDIWKNNGNMFSRTYPGDGLMYQNSAASVDKTTDVILVTGDKNGVVAADYGSADYLLIRNTIQSVWDNDVKTGERLGAKGTSDGNSIYHEDLIFDVTNDVEVYGESNANPAWTIIRQETAGTCGSPTYGIDVQADETEIHGFTVRGVDPAADAQIYSIVVTATDVEIHHNLFQTTDGIDCISSSITSDPAGTADVLGLYIYNNTFEEWGTGTNGYTGVSILDMGGWETGVSDAIRIEDNTFQGDMYFGNEIYQDGVTIARNTYSNDLVLTSDDAYSSGEGGGAIVLYDVSGGLDDILIECNTINGSGASFGWLFGFATNSGGGFYDLIFRHNIVQNCYKGVWFYSSSPIADGIIVTENDLSYEYPSAAMELTSPSIDITAENNWWGSASGPDHDMNSYNKPLQGQRIIDPDNEVDFVPWWGAAPTGSCPLTSSSTSVAPVTLRDGTTEALFSYHTSITDAINNADATNWIIWATSGDYYESLDINNGSVANGISIKGKRSNGLTNAWETNVAGCYEADAPRIVAYDNNTMINFDFDVITLQGFKIDVTTTYNAIEPNIGIWFTTPRNSATIQYCCFYTGDNDIAVNLDDATGALTDLNINYNVFNGPSSTADAMAFLVGDGFGSIWDITNSIINYSSTQFKLSSSGNISDVLINNNTFNNTAGALAIGVEDGDAGPGTTLSNFVITENTFNTGSFDEYALLIVNDDAFPGFDGLTDAEFGTDLNTDILFNNNVINMVPGTYRTVGFSTTPDPNTLSNTFSTDLNAETNFWGSQYGPVVAELGWVFTADQYWWDFTNDGAYTWVRQRSSWNQSLQGPASADNWNVDFFPWSSTDADALADINFDGPIKVTNDDGITVEYYPSFFDVFVNSSGILDEDGFMDLVTMESGTYTEDFGISADDIEIRGNDGAQANYVIETSGDYGILVQKPASVSTEDIVMVHGLTLNGLVQFTVNGTNVEINNNMINNEDGDASIGDGPFFLLTEADIDGLNIHDNVFNFNASHDGISISGDYIGWASEAVNIDNNTFNGDVLDYVIILDASPDWLSIEGNSFLATGNITDVILNDVTNTTISCNQFTSGDDNYGVWFMGNSMNNTVKNNTFRDKSIALFIETDNANTDFVHYNDFADNTIGILLDGTTDLDAENNYWGSTNGPTHATNVYNVGSQGTEIAWAGGGEIDYAPWWTDFVSDCPNDATGTSFSPVKVYDDAAHTNLISEHQSISNAINDNSTQNDYYIVAHGGTYTENVTFPGTGTFGVLDLFFETNPSLVTILGDLTLDNNSDLTFLDEYFIDGDVYFAGTTFGEVSSIILEDADLTISGDLFGSGSSNYVSTEGVGYLARSNRSTLTASEFPVYSGAGTVQAYFPVQVTITKSGVTDATVKARVDGENPVTTFGPGEDDNPVKNTWYLECDETNPDAEIIFTYTDVASHPNGFLVTDIDKTEAGGTSGCWDVSQTKQRAFGARWAGTEWESHRTGSPNIGGNSCKVQNVNTFSPWGVFWGYANSPLITMPDHSKNIIFRAVGEDYITIRVTRGTGNRFAVIVKPDETSGLDCWDCMPNLRGEYPLDGVDYASAPYNVGHDPMDANYQDGWGLPNQTDAARVVYISDNPSSTFSDPTREVKITGLAHGTKYYIQVIEANGIGNYINYNIRSTDWDCGPTNLTGETASSNNGRWRMTVPRAELSFRIGHGTESPILGETDEKHACESWQDYLHLDLSGDQPWEGNYTDNLASMPIPGPITTASYNFLVDNAATQNTTYELVWVKDAVGRICNVYGDPDLIVHYNTVITSIDVDPNPSCGGDVVTLTPNVTGTDATFIRWEWNNSGNWEEITEPQTPWGTSVSINTVTGELTLNGVQYPEDDGVEYRVVYTGSTLGCTQDEEIASDPQSVDVNNTADGGTITNAETPVCPGSTVVLSNTTASGTTIEWQRSTNGGGSWNVVQTGGTSFTITSGNTQLANDGDLYKVVAINPPCPASESNTWTLDVINPPDDWSANDANITVLSKTLNSVTIQWDAVSGATEYRINVYPAGNGTPLYINLHGGSSTTFTISPLSCSTDYDVEVYAKNECGATNTTSDKEQVSTFYPDITVNTCPVNFGNQNVGVPSASQTVTVSGTEFGADLVITRPSARFQISLDNVDWSQTSISLTPDGNGDITSTTIYIRFVPDAQGYVNENISYTSTCLTTYLCEVDGTGVDLTPSVQASNINFSNDQGTSIDVGWTRGNGNFVMVVMSTDDTWELPDNTVSYNVGDDIDGSNDIVIYNGTGTSATPTVTANTNYWFRAYEYNTGYYYNVNTATDNPNYPKYLVFTTQPNSSYTANGSGDAFIDLNVQRRYRDGSALNTTAIVVSMSIETQGSGMSSMSGSNPSIANGDNSTGTFTMTWNAPDGDNNASIGAASTGYFPATTNTFIIIAPEPTTQARTILFTGFTCVGGTATASIQWTNGNGLHRLVVVRQAAQPANPSDYTYYAADDDFGSGDQTGTGSYVVYNGSGNSMTVQSLAASTTYYFRVYEYNGHGSNVTNYNVSTGSFNPRSRRMPDCKAGAGHYYVEVADYKVLSYQKKAFVSFNSLIEQGIVGYEIYRAELSGSEFKLVGSYLNNDNLVGQINSTVTNAYSFVDSDPFLQVGNEYIYQLVAVAVDGSRFDMAEQLVTILALENPNASFEIADVNPNPATTQINFNLILASDASVTIQVIDLQGKVVSLPLANKLFTSGDNQVQISLDGLSNGSYALVVSSGDELAVHRFVIMK